MKKKVFSLGIILLAAAIILCFGYSPLRLRLYFGDRIQGTVQLLIDGNSFSLSEKNFPVNDTLNLRFTDEGAAEVRCRAGEYGDYAFDLLIDELNRPITIHCFQHNWWNILRFELQICLDTAKQTITYSGLWSYYGDDGVRIAEPIDKTQAFSDEGLQIQIG